ncbi:MAG: methionyl-tRNA formyltransferase [Clostridia bacterium]|nr:methionyl-tRNA formyltransferase [Clostridia bacterium]
MNVIFMGTPEFAVPCLERLLEDGHTVSLVVTQGDKPRGRGQKLMPPPVKACAQEHGIPVFQPATLKDEAVQEELRRYAADVFVVVAYGKILPPAVLSMPPYGCINVHASLLPRYRGAAPIQWAVLNGEQESGVTTMYMDEGLDTGDMLLTARTPITPDMTAGDLHDALSVQGAQVLSDTLQALANGTLTRTKQSGESSYASMLSKQLCPLDFEKNASALHNQVRGLNPWPTATAVVGGKVLKIHRTRVGESCDAQPNRVICTSPMTVSCGNGTSLVLLEVQGEGGRRMAADEYFRGHPIAVSSPFAEG